MIQNELKSRDGQRSQTIDVVVEFRALNKVLITYSTSDPKLARDGSNQVHASKANRIRKKNASQEYYTCNTFIQCKYTVQSGLADSLVAR